MANQRKPKGHIGMREGKTKQSYFFSFYVGRHPTTHKKAYWREGGFDTYDEAEIRMHLAIAQFMQNGVPPRILNQSHDDVDVNLGLHLPENPTVEQWLRFWTESHVVNLRPSTRLSYYRHIDHHIIPILGLVPLAHLTTMQVQSMANMLKRRASRRGGTLSPRTVRAAVTVLKSAMSMAVDMRKIEKNPCIGVRLPRLDRRHMEITTAEAANVILAEAKGSRWYPAIVLCAYTGMRRGETLGLVWSAIDFDAGCVRVRVSRTRGDNGVGEGPPKSASSERTIPVTETVLQILEDHLGRQVQEFASLGLVWSDSVHVFTNPWGKPYSPETMSEAFKKFAVAAGYPNVCLHDIRHAHASILIDNGAPLPAVAARLGHSSPRITAEIYVHAGPDAGTRAADLFEDRMNEVEED